MAASPPGITAKETDDRSLATATTESDLDALVGYKFPHACKEISACRICRDNFRDTACYASLRATGNAPLIARFLTYTQTLSKDEGRSVIAASRTGIDGRYRNICNEVSTKGDKIMARWSRFNAARRSTVLRAALPDNFPDDKWAHLCAYFTRGPQSPVSMRDKHRHKFLLPFLDLKDMASDPAKLLQLLEMRTQYPPAQHAWNDHQTTAFGRNSGMLAMRMSDVMISTQQASYGQSVGFEHEAFHRWETIGFPTAEILFEAQQHLYDFLAKVTAGILKGATGPATGCTAWLTAAAGAFASYASRNGQDDVGLFYVPVQHFKPLPTFDIQHIVPAYDTVASIVQAQYCSQQDDNNKWAAAAHELTQPLVERAKVWDTIEVLGACIQQVLRQQSSACEAGQTKLAGELEGAICHTHDTIRVFLEEEYPRLMRRVLLTDAVFDDVRRSNPRVMSVQDDKQKLGILQLQAFESQRLLWALMEIHNDSTSPYTPGAETALAYLEDMLAAGDVKSGTEAVRTPELGML
ncbi:hypothetical protein CLAFUW4_14527 [Fulvia fulva]|uniref:Uncharacterized protein n=1 Tax=Passalora fulva TaxID=5499 RepID=A0A9Q8PMD9_PASFU|nr:uncharacterized protein CLAFUR5_14358 [Fulvia fulva]KAK4609970.1 hypothetical protein CLAFUR0_14522 [Fulvia fulva]UJO25039.1 hypothetical protein CLAFUR5_14358 [Fulvia fulva]WPV22489.1 hypothetical protein CLAFUW4_14527 [Fulvia fulva]